MKKKREEVLYFTDMGGCHPSVYLSEKREKRRWKKMSYETDALKGTLLSAYSQSQPPSVRLPLRAKGVYKIYIGLYPEGNLSGIRVKLNTDPCCTRLMSIPGKGEYLYEAFWKTSLLDNQEIEIFPLKLDEGSPVSTIAYVKLVPAVMEEPKAADLWLGAFNDGGSFMYWNRPTTKREIWEYIEPLRDTAFKKLYWGIAAGDMCNYHTSVGNHHWIDKQEVWRREGDRNRVECFRNFSRKNIDVVKIACEYAKKIGLEFHVYHRLGMVTGAPPVEIGNSAYYYAHPEYQCVDRDGRKISRLSYAFPEVQEHVVSLYKEFLGYDIDGINFVFIRGVPLLLYEEPIIQGFKKRYGMDPRKVSENDRRLFIFRSGIITDFIRRVRNELNSYNLARGRGPVEFSATVLIDRANNHFYNLDIERWVKEGLIDVLIPNPQIRDIPAKKGFDIQYFSRITRGTSCRLAPELLDVRSWSTPEKHYYEKASEFYRAGVDGICFWDLEGRFVKPLDWAIIKSLAYPKTLKKNIKRALAENKKIPLRTVSGFTVDRYPVWWAF
jgi:hypothetical protein